MKSFKFQAFLLALVLSVSGLAGCKKSDDKASQGENFGDGSFPLKTDVTLTYWDYMFSFGSAKVSDRSQTPYGKAMEEATGVKIKYIHPAAGQAEEQFNLLLATNDLPDIIEQEWFNFSGGPEKAMKDGYIIPLNEQILKFAPNLKKYLDENPVIDKMVKTDSGQYYVFPFMRDDASLMVYQGPILRQDWLDELSLSVPETIEEWETTLTAFKDVKGAKAPLSFYPWMLAVGGSFSGAFGVINNFYVDDGRIKHGLLEPEYKEFLKLFKDWYANGLLDNDIATIDPEILDANMLSGRTGATIGNLGGAMGKWLGLMTKENPSYNLSGAPYPVVEKGTKAKFGQRDLEYTPVGSAAISAKSKHIELAARYLDFGYTEKGRLINNFGIEGESYNMVDGYPKYTDLITNNPTGLSMSQAMEGYTRTGGAPTIQDVRYMEQFMETPQQKAALEIWSDTSVAAHLLPRISPTPDESSEMARIMNLVRTYSDEMFYKFIMGSEPMENYDKFIEQIKGFGLERALEIQQNALERYKIR